MVYSNYLIETKLFFRSTSDLETFQNLILKYASKRNFYKPPAFAARNILATLDHNANVDREAVKNKDVSERYFSFATKFVLYSISLSVYVPVFILVYFTSCNFDHFASTHIYQPYNYYLIS